MAFLNTFSTLSERFPFAPRTPDHCAFGRARPEGGRHPNDRRGPRKADAGESDSLMASGVLGAARWLHRHGLIGVHGFRIALAMAERHSARGIAKWRAARRFGASDIENGA